MSKNQRIILFSILAVLLFVIFKLTKGTWVPSNGIDVILFSALMLLAFTVLFLEHFFTKPTDVLASTISILLLMSPLSNELRGLGIWYYIFWFYNFVLLCMAFTALFLLNEEKDPQSWQNEFSRSLKIACVYLGNGKILFFSLFILTLLFYVDSQSPVFLWLFAFATVVLLINPNKMIITFSKTLRPKQEAVGELFGVQSKNVILAKVYKNIQSINKFDIVGFHSSISDTKKAHAGIIIDKYLLDREQWLKILCDIPIANKLLDKDEKKNSRLSDNIIFRLSSGDEFDFVKRLVGIVIENSTIGKIRFEYIGIAKVSEGDLLEVSVRDTKVIYQIVQGVTDTELLESKNESGIIIGEAVQLGVWDAARRNFEKYGWVPDINSSVWLVANIDKLELDKNERQIGTIPHTNYPVLINIDDAISHHIAILGVTGTGKSVFARNLIKQIVEFDRKVICVDFTREYKDKIKGFKTIISYEKDGGKSQADRIFEDIDYISEESEKFASQRSTTDTIEKRRSKIFAEFQNAISRFIKSDDKIGLFELPDVSNTTGILEYTRWFFHTIFHMAKNQNLSQKLCIVIEEAHTVVPEWNFIGDRDKHAGKVSHS